MKFPPKSTDSIHLRFFPIASFKTKRDPPKYANFWPFSTSFHLLLPFLPPEKKRELMGGSKAEGGRDRRNEIFIFHIL